MAAQSEGVAHTVHDYHDEEQQMPSRPKISQRKSSFSEALTKFTSNTFNRRRTNIGLPSSTSSVDINHQSRIPTPAGIDRSTSFFSNLNTFASKSTASTSEESPQPCFTKRPRKISERLAQTPFFSHQHQQQPAITPRSNRESSVKIEQRGLMQPVHPPLPRSNTMGILGQSPGSSPHTPGFMRPTTSSARRSSAMARSDTAAPSSMAGRGSAVMQRQRNQSLRPIGGSNTPSKTPTQARQVSAARFPTRSDSLASTPRMTGEPGPAIESETAPADYSDGANFQITNQLIQERSTAKEGNSKKSKASADLMPETRRVPPAKESQKGILKSKNKQLSDILSNLYVDDEPESSKAEHDDDETKARSDQGTPEYSERTASPESSNPRLVSDRSPLNPIPLHHPLPIGNHFLKPPHPFLPSSQLMHHHLQIHEAQSPIWWLGRYTALSDRFRTGALPSPSSSPTRSHSSSQQQQTDLPPTSTNTAGLTSASSSNANHPMHNVERRNRRVYIHLRSLCTTDEARASLDDFKAAMEAREAKTAGGPQGKAVKEKQGWLDGLMGKKKKGEK